MLRHLDEYWLSMGHTDPLFLGAGRSPDTPSVRSAKKSDIRVLNSPPPSFDLYIPFHTERDVWTLYTLMELTAKKFPAAAKHLSSITSTPAPQIHLLHEGIGLHRHS